MKKLILAGATALALTSAALADFYVVQDTSTRRCSLAEERPTGKGAVVVAGTKVYKTREDAETAMNAAAACKAGKEKAEKKAIPKGQVRLLAQAPTGAASITRLYKQAVYDANDARIGEVDDVLVTNDGRAVALVIGVGGFLGLGETHVVVPFNAVRATNRDGTVRLVMNATRDDLAAATHYRYDKSKYVWTPADRKTQPRK
jgi:sporulation protein YlmC with PRC-barrel domain